MHDHLVDSLYEVDGICEGLKFQMNGLIQPAHKYWVFEIFEVVSLMYEGGVV